MTTPDDRAPEGESVHPKNRIPPEEGIIRRADEIERSDHSPTAGVDPVVDPDAVILDKRPTDGPA